MSTQMRTVILASPCHNGLVDAYHASALSETCKMGIGAGVNVVAIYMAFDSLVQRARNDIFKTAYEANVDDLVFIDTDQDWNPEDFFKLLSHDLPVVGVPVRKKSDDEQYNIKILNTLAQLTIDDQGILEVASVGTGMLRIRKDAIQSIWESAADEEYTEDNKPGTSRMIFDVKIVDGKLYSEDTIFCKRWTDLGNQVFVDTSINVCHAGYKRWQGNFIDYLARLQG
jgi:hypothetical protein